MNDNDFRQFNGTFDSAVEPDSAFAERLRQRMASEEPPQMMPLQSPVSAPLPVRDTRQPAEPPRRNPLYIAAAVLMVFALAAASIVQLAPRVLEEQYASQAVATLPDSAVGTPGPDVALTSVLLPNLGTVGIEALDGNVIYGNAFRADENDDTTPGFLAYDIESGDVLWQMESESLGQVTLGGERIFGSRISTNDTTLWVHGAPPMDLVAIDASSGEELWVTPFPGEREASEWGPILMIGDKLLHIGARSTVAYDATSGQPVWTADYEPVEVPSRVGYYLSPWAVEWEGHLVLLNAAFSGIVLDVETGEQASTFSIPLDFDDLMASDIRMSVGAEGVVIAASVFRTHGPEFYLIEIDPKTGNVLKETAVQEPQINTATVANGTIVLMASEWKSPPWILQLLRRGGYSLTGIVWIDAGTGDEILRTEKTRSDVIYASSLVTNGEYVCYMSAEYTCFDRNGTRYLTGVGDPVMWALMDANSVYLSTEDGTVRVDLP